MVQREGRYNIRAVERALSLLSVLSDGKPRTLTELSAELGINSSTAFRMLATLAANNYVERDDRSAYRLSIGCLELARAYQAGSELRRVALPELERLRDETKETVHLAVIDKMEVVYQEKLHGLHAIGIMSSQVGGRLPAYCTGLGKVLLAHTDLRSVRSYYEKNGLHQFSDATIQSVEAFVAHLQKIHDQGFALDRGEHEAEVRCIAAPIFGISGKVIAAISISGPASRMDPIESQFELIGKTVDSARVISMRLGHRVKA